MKVAVAVLVLALLVPVAVLAQYTPTTIYAVQQHMFPVNTDVQVTNVVVTAVDLKPTTYGFVAQEIPGGPWSGILCYTSSTDPYATWDVEVGDLVEVLGTYTEYPATGSQVSEIDVDDVTIITKGYGAPACTLLSCGDLGREPADSTFAEKWEGVFICVDTVQVGSLWPNQEFVVGEYHNHPGSGLGDSLVIDDKLVDPTINQPAVGDTIALIKGVYSEEWGTYRLWPRGLFDIEFMGPAPGPNLLLAFATSDTSLRALFDRELDQTSAQNKNNYYLESETSIISASLMANHKTVILVTAVQPDTLLDSLVVCDVKSQEGTAMFECQKQGFYAGITPMWYVQRPAVGSAYFDDSQLMNQEVTVSGTVTSSSPDFGGPFFMRDDKGPWNSLYIYWPGAHVSLGDSIIVAGFVSEYYGLTELGSIDYYFNLGSKLPVYPDTVLNTVLMADSMASESYEACLVYLDSMEVTTFPDAYGEWDVNDIGHSANVPVGDFAIQYGDYGYAYPGLGSIIGIQGCFRYDYGEYKLEPRDSSDIFVIDPCEAGAGATRDLRTRLDQNTPNPFVHGTAITFAVPSQTRVKVAVYDVSGRLVKEIADQVMTAGEHTLTWNGKDSRNEEVGPGIYFYTFTTPKGSIEKKMVVLR
jgi:hypothetical protein